MDAADSLLKKVEPAEEGPRTKPTSKYEVVKECQNFLQAEFGGGDASHTTQGMAPVTEGNTYYLLYFIFLMYKRLCRS